MIFNDTATDRDPIREGFQRTRARPPLNEELG
jgi:hypothetical protein